jgi:hypothetical protein
MDRVLLVTLLWCAAVSIAARFQPRSLVDLEAEEASGLTFSPFKALSRICDVLIRIRGSVKQDRNLIYSSVASKMPTQNNFFPLIT